MAEELVIQGDFNALDETLNFGSRQFAVGDSSLHTAYTKLTFTYAGGDVSVPLTSHFASSDPRCFVFAEVGRGRHGGEERPPFCRRRQDGVRIHQPGAMQPGHADQLSAHRRRCPSFGPRRLGAGLFERRVLPLPVRQD